MPSHNNETIIKLGMIVDPYESFQEIKKNCRPLHCGNNIFKCKMINFRQC